MPKKQGESKFNPEQEKAIHHGEGPLLIIAGAGTGKTTVVTERIKYLISSGRVKPQEILALTFTEKASREMEERVDQALPYGMTQMWISTFHAFCDRVLRNEGIHIGINPGFQLMTDAESVMMFKKQLFNFPLQYFRPLGNPTKFIRGILTHFSRLADEDVNPKQYEKWVASEEKNLSSLKNASENEESDTLEIGKYKELMRVYAKYQEIKVKNGKFDYGDLLSFTLQLFRTRPNILKQYQEQFPYILIDEFQDTNFAQNELAILLAGEKQNVTVVGDDDQAIYRWRGAALSNMIQFRSHFPNLTTVVLTKNYRSTKEILDRSYDLVQFNNPDRLEVAENVDKKLESMRRLNGEPIKILYADRVEDEAEEVAKAILSHTQKGIKFSDIAILVRANQHSHPFSRAMERYGIPFQFLGPGQLFRQAEIKDLIAYLTILTTLDDSVAMYRVLTMEWLTLNTRDLAGMVTYAKRAGITLFEVAELVAFGEPKNDLRLVDTTTKEKVTRLMTMVKKHLALLKRETAGQILYAFLEETGILLSISNYKTEKQEHIALNIAKFFDKLKTYEAEHEDASVFVVLDWVNLSLELGESPLATNNDWSENNAVNILTVHSSKGLEFPVVFVVNLVSQRFPTIERKEQIPIPDALIREILPSGDFHLQEERRLFYVAMTRARDFLYLTAAKYYGDGKREKKLSPFIAESLGIEVVEKALEKPAGDTTQLSLFDWAKPTKEEVDKKSTRPVLQPITYLSYSQVDTFITCPLQYKYRYIVKIPVPPSAALVFGDTMHRTIRAFYEKVRLNEKPTYDDLLTIYETAWVSMGFGNKSYEERMKTHGKELLEGFFTKSYDETRVPRNLEEPFRIKITPMLKLGGKVDRVDVLPDGKIEIIDYKTGQAPKGKDARSDLQLTVYAMAATDKGIYGYRPEDVIVSFYFFEGQEKVSATRTHEQLEEARQKITSVADEMSKSTFPANPGKQCDFCEFRLICEAWQ